MKFYFGVITAGFLIATVAAGSFSNLNLLAKNLGTLGITNLAKDVPRCPDTNSVGTLEGFVVVDADSNTCPSLPCVIEKGKRYGVIYILGCGDTENSYTLEVTMDEDPEYTILQQSGAACTQGQLATVTFVFDTFWSATNGVHPFRFRLVGSSTQNESCIEPTFNVVSPAM